MPRNPNKTRCTFPGCHNWAMHGQERCHVHRYAEADAAYQDALQALAATLLGAPGAPGESSGEPSSDGPPPTPPPGPDPRESGATDYDFIDDDPLGLLPPPEVHAAPDPSFPPAGGPVDPGQVWLSDPAPTDLDAHIARLDAGLRGLAAHVRRLDAQLEHDPALLPAYTRLLNLQGQLTSRLARLLRERQQIRHTDDQDLFHDAMNAALDQLSEDWGVQL